MSQSFDINELESMYTERSMVAEATNRATTRKGDYVATIKAASPRVAEEKSPFPGRRMISLQVTVQNTEGQTVTLFQDVSWELYRELTVAGQRTLVKPGDEGYDHSLKMDKPARLWSQIEKAFNPDGELSIAELVKALPGSTIGVFVMEGFINDSNDMIWPEARPNDFSTYEEYVKEYDAEKATAISQGYQPKNFVSNFHKIKEG